ncbi:riboflavin synthase [Sporolactobacillus sp. THM7-7]|nr:riboflavin synthase [Sporolactobacillus sp. THM7-7]
MFTGIVEEMGRVSAMEEKTDAIRLTVRALRVLEDASVGDSISVNGVCVTVTDRSASSFSADIMPETIKATTLKELGRDDPVNLERAIQAGGRYGGHFVTGHVDGTGKIVRTVLKGNARYLDIEASRDVLSGLVQKGSVAVDGTSLTVFRVGDRSFTISLIPHTAEQTILGRKDVGDKVNIECDVLQKYIRKQKKTIEKPPTQTLTYEALRENGFIH